MGRCPPAFCARSAELWGPADPLPRDPGPHPRLPGLFSTETPWNPSLGSLLFFLTVGLPPGTAFLPRSRWAQGRVDSWPSMFSWAQTVPWIHYLLRRLTHHVKCTAPCSIQGGVCCVLRCTDPARSIAFTFFLTACRLPPRDRNHLSRESGCLSAGPRPWQHGDQSSAFPPREGWREGADTLPQQPLGPAPASEQRPAPHGSSSPATEHSRDARTRLFLPSV